jgi:putative membrane protein
MKALLIAAGAAALLGGCAMTPPPRGYADAGADEMSPLRAPGYLANAASSDMFEIESSRLALQMSQNQAVRWFAQMMINDHSRTTSELMGAAQQIGLRPPPPQMLPRHAAMLDRLRAAPPGEFDRAYKAEQIMAHEEALMLHRNFAERGDAPLLRDVAARAVPIVDMHYRHAQQLPDYVAAPPPADQPAPPLPPRRRGERG